MAIRLAFGVALISLAAACYQPAAVAEDSMSGTPLYNNLGKYHFPITTSSPDAQ